MRGMGLCALWLEMPAGLGRHLESDTHGLAWPFWPGCIARALGLPSLYDQALQPLSPIFGRTLQEGGKSGFLNFIAFFSFCDDSQIRGNLTRSGRQSSAASGQGHYQGQYLGQLAPEHLVVMDGRRAEKSIKK